MATRRMSPSQRSRFASALAGMSWRITKCLEDGRAKACDIEPELQKAQQYLRSAWNKADPV